MAELSVLPLFIFDCCGLGEVVAVREGCSDEQDVGVLEDVELPC